MKNIFFKASLAASLLIFGCAKKSDPEEIHSAEEPHFLSAHDCIALAQVSLEKFEENKYILVDKNQANQKDTLWVEYSWNDSNNREHTINCYFKKK